MSRLIDLNHVITDGMETYPGLPGPKVCDFWTRESTAAQYDDGSTFHIARLDMVANTGTYLDSPYHRFDGGTDIAGLSLASIANLPGICVDARGAARVIEPDVLEGIEIADHAILFRTDWSRHWGTPKYQEANPCLAEETAAMLAAAGACLVGIDSLNIDDTTTQRRPVHTTLLGAGIPVVEHLCRLDRLPRKDFRFTAVPPRIEGMGTFPVRAFAELD
ncbi:MAG: cyclase family protein [Gammaproteobacteria bacterium]|nr:cyclase family protein [Gammaproteobacteria bacterium]